MISLPFVTEMTGVSSRANIEQARPDESVGRGTSNVELRKEATSSFIIPRTNNEQGISKVERRTE